MYSSMRMRRAGLSGTHGEMTVAHISNDLPDPASNSIAHIFRRRVYFSAHPAGSHIARSYQFLPASIFSPSSASSLRFFIREQIERLLRLSQSLCHSGADQRVREVPIAMIMSRLYMSIITEIASLRSRRDPLALVFHTIVDGFRSIRTDPLASGSPSSISTIANDRNRSTD